MSTPYIITNDAGQRIGKAVVAENGSTQVSVPPNPPHTYPTFAEAKTAVGGNWFAIGG